MYSSDRAYIIALIPLVKWSRGTANLGKGLRGIFWSRFRKRKVERPSVQTLYENRSYLTKIGLPKAKGRVYFGSQCHCNVYSARRREGLGKADSDPAL